MPDQSTDQVDRGWAGGAGVRHVDPVMDAWLAQMLDLLSRQAVWVRPAQESDGANRVRDQLGMLTRSPFTIADLANEAQSMAGRLRCEDAESSPSSWLAYQTSGSTGGSKCVVYRDAEVISHAEEVIRSLRVEPTHFFVALPSPRFAYGLSIVLSHARAGVPVLFSDASGRFLDVDVRNGSVTKPLAIYLLPQQVPLLLKVPIDPGRVERIFLAGGRISGPSVEALVKRFPNLHLTNMYGQAEMGPRLSVWDGDPARFVEGSIGRPINGVRLKLADEERGNTEPVPLLASSDHAMWKCLKPPYEAFEDGPGSGEFIDTGDLAMRAPDGGLIHHGRGDHVLNVAGTKVDLRQVTQLIQERFRPIIVRVTSRPAHVAGDSVPVIQVVPAADGSLTSRDVRQTLHSDYGNLASLFEIRIVEQLNLGESGK